jgi:hypothetical protein
MERQKGMILSVMIFSLVLIVNGCATSPKIRPQRGQNERISLQDLVKNWQDYDILYAGWSVTDLYGIMFDPKNNDMTLGGSRWKKIEDQDTREKIFSQVPDKTRYPSRIVGPDDEFYGYILYIKREGAQTQRAVVRVVDDHNLTINFETYNTQRTTGAGYLW